ncbi:MAG TPA: hypothetical protein VGG92_09080, partial [Caulobacteraceae bacterium]
SLVGNGAASVHGKAHPNYLKMVLDWQAKADVHVQGDIGHVPGTIVHGFHGWKPDRNYVGRWSILTDNAYDPETDVVKDSQGMLRLTAAKPALRDGLRRYFRQRFEDAGRKSWPV